MKKYIDAELLKTKFLGKLGSRFPAWAVRQIIDDIPAADVQEVVHCKDCRYISEFTDGHCECRLLYDLKPIPATYCTMKLDDFCSYGERKNER